MQKVHFLPISVIAPNPGPTSSFMHLQVGRLQKACALKRNVNFHSTCLQRLIHKLLFQGTQGWVQQFSTCHSWWRFCSPFGATCLPPPKWKAHWCTPSSVLCHSAPWCAAQSGTPPQFLRGQVSCQMRWWSLWSPFQRQSPALGNACKFILDHQRYPIWTLHAIEMSSSDQGRWSTWKSEDAWAGQGILSAKATKRARIPSKTCQELIDWPTSVLLT